MTDRDNLRAPEPGGLAGTFDRMLLYLVAFMTGAVIMMIEVLGTRIIGPFYGVSLFVWSSLISAALIALALGYYLGGIVADRAGHFQMSYGIALAALWTALIPWSRPRFCSRPKPWEFAAEPLPAPWCSSRCR